MTSDDIYVSKIKQIAINNKYTKWYIAICSNAKNRLTKQNKFSARKEAKEKFGYIEGHHIFPRCICNQDEERDFNNYAFITAKEHFICHVLLSKMFVGELKFKMTCAMFNMTQSTKNHKRYSSNTYEMVKRHHALEKSKMYSWTKIRKRKEPSDKEIIAMKNNGERLVSFNKNIDTEERLKINKKISNSMSGRVLHSSSLQNLRTENATRIRSELATERGLKRQWKNGFKVEYNNVCYPCLKYAAEHLGLHIDTIRKYARNNIKGFIKIE